MRKYNTTLKQKSVYKLSNTSPLVVPKDQKAAICILPTFYSFGDPTISIISSFIKLYIYFLMLV